MDAADRAAGVIEKEMESMIADCKGRLQGDNQTGLCVGCDALIPAGRMKVVPGAARCVVCQNDFEGN